MRTPGYRSRLSCGQKSKKRLGGRFFWVFLAEEVRFELTGPCEPPVFKTGAIDHSATLPVCRRPLF